MSLQLHPRAIAITTHAPQGVEVWVASFPILVAGADVTRDLTLTFCPSQHRAAWFYGPSGRFAVPVGRA